MSKPTQNVISYDSSYVKYRALHFGGIHRLACRAISSSVALLVFHVYAVTCVRLLCVGSDAVKEFHLAVMRLDCRKVVSLLRGDEDAVNWTDDSSRTATMLLARRPATDCRCRSHVRRSVLDALSAAGARLDAVDSAGNTALMHAVLSSSADVVDWLLEAGADARRANDVGVTPLWQAVFDVTSRHKLDRWPIVRRLLTAADCGVDARCRGPLLFSYGVEHVYCYEEPVSALDVAVDAGCRSTARLLVGAGCSSSASPMMSVSATDVDGCVSWLDELVAESRSLQHLCRLVVRRRLGLRLDAVVQSLPLPVQLQSFLLLDNIPVPSYRAVIDLCTL